MSNPLLEAKIEAESEDVYAHHSTRRQLCLRYSWAVPNDEAIAFLVGVSPIIEVGAGTGYWASLVAAAGGDIIASDIEPAGSFRGVPYKPNWHADYEPHFEVVQADSALIAGKYPERTLMLCWPHGGDDGHDARAVRSYHSAGGQRLVFIGEVHGCTGSDELMAHLGFGSGVRCYKHDFGWEDDEECTCSDEPPEVLFESVEEIEIPQWDGLHDSLHLCERVA